MPIPVEAGLLTVTDLENHLHRAIATKDDDSALAAVLFAVACVTDVVGFDVMGDEYTVTESDQALAKGIAVRIAAQAFTNPEDRAQYSGPEGLSYTASPQMLSKIMSEADRRTLVSIQLRYAPGFA
ncbi:MAG: hypothetical protein IPN92_21035 [Chromatiaceae bacterium]|nr:hypothetical protein [Chromatiaceae bacterium]